MVAIVQKILLERDVKYILMHVPATLVQIMKFVRMEMEAIPADVQVYSMEPTVSLNIE